MSEASFVADERLFGLEENKYLLVNVAAYRGRQINEGVEVYVKSKSRHPLQVALEEIVAGKIDYTVGESEPEEEEETQKEDIFRFDEMIDLEGDFDLEDEDAFEIEDLDFEEDFEEADEA